MSLWIPITIISYLFFGISFFGDKLILSGSKNIATDAKKIPKAGLSPLVYTFYVGLLSALVIFCIPFISLNVPGPAALAWSVAEGLVYILSVYALFYALEKFEVSRVAPTIGALQPLCILFFTWLIWGPQVVTGMNLLAFTLLLLGGIIISVEKVPKFTGRYLAIALFAALMFSLDYMLSKLVFLHLSFLEGMFWMRISSLAFIMLLLFKREVRQSIFKKKTDASKKTGALFVLAQSSGGVGGVMQLFAIFLAPVAYLPIINSLRGVQYVFLFAITLICSVFFPKILKEEISKRAIIQKLVSILLIIWGLAIIIS